MLFNSLVFAVFLPLVFALYWALRQRLRAQNIVLIAAGFLFYGWWDPRFLLLLIATSLTDYIVALALGRTPDPKKRRWLLAISLIGNLGTLGTFKYFDFFSHQFADLMARFGFSANPVLLDVILPVGISFYTFQALSYTIDVYRKRIEPVHDIAAFMAFISFFPQLCAGPIERASNMLPQFQRKRVFDPLLAADGMRQMLWGFFKKAVIADGCAPLVNGTFAHVGWHDGCARWPGPPCCSHSRSTAISAATRISLWALARLFGFELMRNFAYPYFSRDIAEFWRRWHISLSTWFRDYVYVPLGGSRGTRAMQVRNVFVIFLLSGFWHGANWTFLAWGAINALLFLPLLLHGKNRKHGPIGALATWRDLPAILLTFACTTVAWIFFRAESIGEAMGYLRGMLSPTLFRIPKDLDPWLMAMIAILIAVEWLQRARPHGLEVAHLRPWMRRACYTAVFLLIFFFGHFGKAEFIYFQF
ncbi:MAG: MBOAT family protein [Flavobacteriales bacterium]|nr:MBOAT family protein [Flavobacteriales bacterium]